MSRARRSSRPKDRPFLHGALDGVRGRLAAGVLCHLGAALAAVTPLIAVAELARLGAAGVFDDAEVPAAEAWALVAVAAAALALRVGLTAAGLTLTHVADTTLQLRLRRDLARHLGRLPLMWFGERNSGIVKRAVADDVGALHHLVAHALPNLVTAVVTPVVSVGYLLTVDWLLTVVTLVPLALGAVAYRRAMRDVAARMGEYLAATQRLDASVVEFVQGISVVKVFGGGGRAHRRFQDGANQYAAFIANWSASVTPWMAASQILYSPPVVLLVMLVGGAALVSAGSLTFAGLAPFVVVGLGISGPALTIGYGMQDVAAGRAAAGRIERLLDTPTLPQPASPAPAPPHQDVVVEFQAVRFSYDGQHEVLHGITLTLRPGTVTAVVGPSGAGKSTLATLTARFADVTGGAVRLAGTDVRDLTSEQLYGLVGFVFQDVQLLRASLADNIRLARPDADLDAVRAAARAARIHDRIEQTPRGYDSVVGVDTTLSMGEAQRVSIARALLADTPVLVLDEATAFADPECEADIQDALSVLVAGRTVLVVAHRLATIVEADQIAVLDEGRLVECGRHAELLAAGGRYAELWRARQAPPTPALTGPGGAQGGAHA
ncbi:ABC transporter ATP-binding protein [Actinomycetes bacterium KLBMP 9797]